MKLADPTVDALLVPFRTTKKVESANGYFNDEFCLRFYLPRRHRDDPPLTRLFIMLNGFAEATTDFWDQMAANLAAGGVASLLLPLPDHFCRNIFFNRNSFDEKDPFHLVESDVDLKLFTDIMKQELLAHPDRFIRFNKQLMGEIARLIELVGGEESIDYPDLRRVLARHFVPNPTLSIVGFSLGGLCALQASLLNAGKFNSCVLVNSGASFQDMDGAEMFGENEWHEHQLSLTRAAAAYRDLRENFFHHVMLGDSRCELQNRLEEESHRILVILGGRDSIINFRTLANLEPKKSGLAIVQIPGLEHHINIKKRGGSTWGRWEHFAADTILSFDKNHPREPERRRSNQ